VANESIGNHKTLTKFFNLQRTIVSWLRNASRTLKLCQNISIWDIKRTIECRHIFKFSGLIFLYIFFCFLFYSTYGCANGIRVIIEGQYKSIGEKLILVFDLLTLNT